MRIRLRTNVAGKGSARAVFGLAFVARCSRRAGCVCGWESLLQPVRNDDRPDGRDHCRNHSWRNIRKSDGKCALGLGRTATVKKALLSWSTGKDSAWALHLLSRDAVFDVVGLITTFNSAADRVA